MSLMLDDEERCKHVAGGGRCILRIYHDGAHVRVMGGV